ncbi:MAG: nuclear transport factor 2 family protein [Aquabacterium sp.]|nr:nuclear transport factor 2 family protein [Aquabacterium sp.]
MQRSKPQTAHLMASPDDVEAQFYEALREADLDKLMALWADDDEVFCVHPGGPRVVGPQAIRVAFEAVFAANGRIHAFPERVRRLQALGTAVHNLVERIELQTDEGPRTGYVLATNVYLKTAQGWRLVAHHASPGTAQETPEIVEAPSVLH